MSYILDALRRAESERQRGQVPGLGAVPLPAPAVAGPAASRAGRWAAAGMAVLGLAAALLWWLQRPAAVPLAGGAAAGAAAQVQPATAQTTGKATAEAGDGGAPARAVPPSFTSAAPAAPATPAAPPPLPVVVSAPVAVAPKPAPEPVPVPVQVQGALPPSSALESTLDKRSVKLAELTPQQRAEWPALSVGGSVWSDSASSRFVILNGQVLREGQPVLPGLTLERIQPRAVMLRWRGLLVELPL